MKRSTSFRLKQEVLNKLEKIREYHQEKVNDAFLKDDSLMISKAAIIEGIIEQTYLDMVQDGQIRE